MGAGLAPLGAVHVVDLGVVDPERAAGHQRQLLEEPRAVAAVRVGREESDGVDGRDDLVRLVDPILDHLHRAQRVVHEPVAEEIDPVAGWVRSKPLYRAQQIGVALQRGKNT
eukprot:scaffold430160_cov33-Prasinocladus_malaysianus.AAC.1